MEILELKNTITKASMGRGESWFNNRVNTSKKRIDKEKIWSKETVKNEGETKEWKIYERKHTVKESTIKEF